jgi:Family of unknown function (DUF6245)
MTKHTAHESGDTPATVTQLAAALAALGHYAGTNSDAEHAQEAARVGGASFYHLLLANALLGHVEGEAVRADGMGVSADQMRAAHRQALAVVGAIDEPIQRLRFLRWRALRVAGPLRDTAQDPTTGPVALAAAHAAEGLQQLLALCAAGQDPESASPEDLRRDLQDARDALTTAVANLDIMWRLVQQVEDLSSG